MNFNLPAVELTAEEIIVPVLASNHIPPHHGAPMLLKASLKAGLLVIY